MATAPSTSDLLSDSMRSHTRPLKIAVEGCGHGSLDYIYETLQGSCITRGWNIADLDFLIICGDFQAVRNHRDLNCMSVPRKYRHLGDFHKYYSGEKVAPVLTIVIGGNHEASNYFSELHYGGWLAPNIYYTGAVSILHYGPLRIAGISGIYNQASYLKPHSEQLPFDRDEIRSIYHVRKSDISKLLQIQASVDIGLSHDWPRRVEWFGDHQKLFADRPDFWESARMDRFGSVPAEEVLYRLKPKYWFSGHMHIRFTAEVHHKGDMRGNIFKDLDVSSEVQRELARSMFTSQSRPKAKDRQSQSLIATNPVTKFLALDKPGSGRDFLELLEVEIDGIASDNMPPIYTEQTSDGKFILCYDEEWLTVLRTGDDGEFSTHMMSENRGNRGNSQSLAYELSWVRDNITANGLLRIPHNFERHAPIHDAKDASSAVDQPKQFPNSQTHSFCEMLRIADNSVGEVDGPNVQGSVLFE